MLELNDVMKYRFNLTLFPYPTAASLLQIPFAPGVNAWGGTRVAAMLSVRRPALVLGEEAGTYWY